MLNNVKGSSKFQYVYFCDVSLALENSQKIIKLKHEQ